MIHSLFSMTTGGPIKETEQKDGPLTLETYSSDFSHKIAVLKPLAWGCLSLLASATTSEFVVKNCQGHLVPLGANERG